MNGNQLHKDVWVSIIPAFQEKWLHPIYLLEKVAGYDIYHKCLVNFIGKIYWTSKRIHHGGKKVC
ncbi:alternative oxidase [Paenibacillus sp. NAIST15-1]|nr:alternative oxidase [Paenibacillus sp. NAIST15-1]